MGVSVLKSGNQSKHCYASILCTGERDLGKAQTPEFKPELSNLSLMPHPQVHPSLMKGNHIAEAKLPSIWGAELFLSNLVQMSPKNTVSSEYFGSLWTQVVATKALSVGWGIIATEAYVFSWCVCLTPPDYILCVGYERGVILTSVLNARSPCFCWMTGSKWAGCCCDQGMLETYPVSEASRLLSV